MRYLPHLLRRFVVNGRLNVIDHDGSRQSFGTGENGPDVTIRFTDARVERDIFFNPELKAAEAYMDGRMVFEPPSRVHDLLFLFSVNRRTLEMHPVQKVLEGVWRGLKRWHQANTRSKAADNAQSHYDVPTGFYKLWLDESMTYSCAYFERPGMTLEEAQIAKFRHIAAKLKLEPGMTVLDIGSGWGGLGIYLARTCGAKVTGINVAVDQLEASRVRAKAAGVEGSVVFIEKDYRDMEGKFDRVVSVGMMEHVGVNYFDAYFGKVKALLGEGGFAMIHAIGRMSPPGTTSPFIRKYIFPGGYAPAMSEVFASTERMGLWVDDCEILRLHYYWTVKAWRERFEAKRGEVVQMLGERFARIWEFYLSAAELGFLHGSNMIYQLLLSTTRDAVPLTRDFITRDEDRLKAIPATG